MSAERDTNKGLTLLKRGQRGLVHAIFSRFGLIVLLLLLQFFMLLGMFFWLEEILPYFVGGRTLFTIVMVLYLLNSRIDPTARLTWLVVLMLMPVVGALFFWYTQKDPGCRALRRRFAQVLSQTKGDVAQNPEVLAKLFRADAGAAGLSQYLQRSGAFPVYDRTSVVYFPTGEDKWSAMLKKLKEAKKFIFLEYFIIDEGVMWGKVLEILAQKAKEGVEVRVMYDGTCEFSTLPHGYPKQLRKLGIACKIFGRVVPFVSTGYNYRDHRKILVIDGQIAFTGGVNLADEYINQRERFGHWKDTAVMLEGEAVKSFTLMFLQMWNIDERKIKTKRYVDAPVLPAEDAPGFVIPYADSPLDKDKVGERVYMDLLNRARDYVYIMSPYLILDGELETALKFAAERGVDVKLVLPGIPDKKAPYALAKTHYASLLESGIQIYEYTPGFVHAKVFVCDGCEAVVGTINLDYRSLYHHFECALYMYATPCIQDIVADYTKTLTKCSLVTAQTMRKEKLLRRLFGYLLKVVAPLM